MIIIPFVMWFSFSEGFCQIYHIMMITSCNLFAKNPENFLLGDLVFFWVIKYTCSLVSHEFGIKNQFCPVARMVGAESRGQCLLYLSETNPPGLRCMPLAPALSSVLFRCPRLVGLSMPLQPLTLLRQQGTHTVYQMPAACCQYFFCLLWELPKNFYPEEFPWSWNPRISTYT